MSGEFALLECLARVDFDEDARATAARISTEGVSWTEVLRLARSHGVVPLLWRNLPEDVPANVGAQVEADARLAATRGLELSRELVRISKILKEDALSAMPFKGPTLAQHLYRNVALRQSVDLDFLLPRSSVDRAAGLLAANEYRAVTSIEDPWVRLWSNEVAMVRAADGLLVELQWRLAPAHLSVPFSLASVWRRRRQQEFGGMTISSPSDEDLALMLCIHGAKHLWERLIWVCDVAQLVDTRPDVDWEAVASRARESRVERMLHTGLVLANAIYGTEIPAAIRVEPASRALAAKLRSLMSDQPRQEFPVRRADLEMRERSRDRASYLIKLAVFPSPGDSEWLPRRLWWLTPVLRPFRLAWKWGLKN